MIKDSLSLFFKKQKRLYANIFGTLPTVSFDPDLENELYVGSPDDDGDIQWEPHAAETTCIDNLCNELSEFYNSFYYCELRGEYNKITFDFPAIVSKSEAERIIKAAIADGEYYCPNKNVVLLATCSYQGNDDIILLYKQDTGKLYLYDIDNKTHKQLKCSLYELLSSMEAIF